MRNLRLSVSPPGVFLFFIFCVVFCPGAAAEFSSRTLCQHADLEVGRSLRVVYPSHSELLPCRVLYQKDGAEQELASAKNTAGFCEKTERQVVRNLVGAGWQCHHEFSDVSAPNDSDYGVVLKGIGSRTGALALPGSIAEFDPADHLLFSATLDNEQAAHHLAAAVVHNYPGLNPSVIETSDGAVRAFQVLLGTASSIEPLKTIETMLNPFISSHFRGQTAGTHRSPEPPSLFILEAARFPVSVQLVPDDQPRYRIAQCLANGHHSLAGASLAGVVACTGYQLDKSLISACLAGGTCLPEMAPDPSMVPVMQADSVADSLTVWSVDRARLEAMQRAGECTLAASGLAWNSMQCVARFLLDTDQQFVLDCYEGSQDLSDFASCTGQESVDALLDSGSLAQQQAVQCLLEGFDTPLQVLDCAGGRLGAAELRTCRSLQLSLEQCFKRPVLLQDIVARQSLQPVALQTVGHRIVDFRAQLFESQGGDLQTVLSDIELAGWSGGDSTESGASATPSFVQMRSVRPYAGKASSSVHGADTQHLRRPFERFGIAK